MIKETIKKRPWILLIVLMGVLILLNIIFVVIAVNNQPVMVN